MTLRRILASVVFLGALIPVQAGAEAGAGRDRGVDWTFYNAGDSESCGHFIGAPNFAYDAYGGGGAESPYGCNPDHFVGYGIGYFVSPVSAPVVFCAAADDLVDITINNDTVIDDAVFPSTMCGTYELLAGSCYTFALTYVEIEGYSTLSVTWGDAPGETVAMEASDFLRSSCFGGATPDLGRYRDVTEQVPSETLPTTK